MLLLIFDTTIVVEKINTHKCRGGFVTKGRESPRVTLERPKSTLSKTPLPHDNMRSLAVLNTPFAFIRKISCNVFVVSRQWYYHGYDY